MRALMLLLILVNAGWLLVLPQPTQAAIMTYEKHSDAGAAESSSEAARMAQERFGGTVLKVKAEGDGKNRKYRVRLLLDDGRVKEVTIRGR